MWPFAHQSCSSQASKFDLFGGGAQRGFMKYISFTQNLELYILLEYEFNEMLCILSIYICILYT